MVPTSWIRMLQNPLYQLVTDSRDTKEIKRQYPQARDYDGFFVMVEDGDITELWGFEGIVPYLEKAVFRIV